MQVRKKYFFMLLIVTANLMFYMVACDITGERDITELPEPGFNYEIVDENGITINRVTHKKIDEPDDQTTNFVSCNNCSFSAAYLLDFNTSYLSIIPRYKIN